MRLKNGTKYQHYLTKIVYSVRGAWKDKDKVIVKLQEDSPVGSMFNFRPVLIDAAKLEEDYSFVEIH